MLCIILYLHLSGHSGNARILSCSCLNLTQFNAESAQFHLVVNSAHELQFAIFIVASQVTSTIHLSRHKRTITEFLGCQFRSMPIAFGHLCTCQTQFTGDALWQQVTIFIADERETIGDRTSDGDIHIFILINNMIG